MTTPQPNRAPLGCREPRCSHVVEITVKGEPRDRCAIHKPMHAGCPWHTKNERKSNAS